MTKTIKQKVDYIAIALPENQKCDRLTADKIN